MGTLKIDITGDNSNVLRAFNGVQQGVTKMQKVIEDSGMSIEQMFNRIQNAAKASLAGFTVKEFVQKVATVRGEFQKLEVAFTTMLGSGEKADALMQQLTKTAATTPFDLKGVADGAKQLLAYGTAAEEVNDTLIHLGDIAAGLSIPLGDLVMLYGTTMTQGRMFTQDLRQFMGRGIPLAEELAKQFGVTKDKVGELVTAGKVGAEEFKKAIMAMSSEGGKFSGLMEAQSKTISGQISNIEDAIDTMFNEIGQNSEGLISGALSGVSTLIENYDKVGQAIMTVVACYGEWKAAEMLLAATQNAIAGQRAAIEAERQSGLAAVVAEYNAAVAAENAETAAEEGNTAAKSANKTAMDAEVAAILRVIEAKLADAEATLASAEQESLLAQNRLREAQASTAYYEKQYQAALKLGDGERIEAAENALNTAASNENAAAKAAQAAQDNVATAAKAKEAAATQLASVQTKVDTVNKQANTAATGLWAAATRSVTAAMHALKAAMASNPFGLALVAITSIISLLTLFRSETEETTDALEKLRNAVMEDTAKLNTYRAVLENTDKTSKTYHDNLSKLNQLAGEYGVTLFSEKDTVEQLTEKYNELTEAINANAAQKLLGEAASKATEDAMKAEKDAMDALIEEAKDASVTETQTLGYTTHAVTTALDGIRNITSTTWNAISQEVMSHSKDFARAADEGKEAYEKAVDDEVAKIEGMLRSLGVTDKEIEHFHGKLYEYVATSADGFQEAYHELGRSEAQLKGIASTAQTTKDITNEAIEGMNYEQLQDELKKVQKEIDEVNKKDIDIDVKDSRLRDLRDMLREINSLIPKQLTVGSDADLERRLKNAKELRGQSVYGSEDWNKYNEQVKQLNTTLSVHKKEYAENAVKSSKDAQTVANERAKLKKEQAEYIALVEEHKRERERAVKDMQLSTRQAEIEAMNESSEKTIKQLQLDFEKRREEIERGYEDLKQQKIEAAKKLWEANPANKGKVFDASTVDVSYTAVETENYRKQLEANNKALRDSIEEQHKIQAQSMRDYLQEYGTFQQQRLAIAQEYAEKIAKAEAGGNKWEVKRLTAERDSRIAQANAQSLAMNIDWNQTFQGIGNVLQDIAKETLQKVNDYMGTAEFKGLDAAAKKAYTDLKQTLIDTGGQTASNPFSSQTWDEIADLTEQYKSHVKALAEESEKHTAAVTDYQKAVDKEKQARADLEAAIKAQASHLGKADQGEYDKAVEEARQNLADATQGVADTFQQMQETGEAVQQQQTNVSNTQQNLHQKTEAAAQGLNNFNTVLGQLTSGTLTGFVNGVSNVINALTKKTDDDMQGLIGVIGQKAGGIIGAILSIIDMLGDKPVEFFDGLFDGISKVIEAVISHIPEIIGSVIKGVGNIVGSVFKGIGGLLGFGGADNSEEQLAKQDEIRSVIESATHSIDKLTEALEKSYGAEAMKTAQQLEEKYKNQAVSQIAGLDAALWSNYGGGHSDYWHWNKNTGDIARQIAQKYGLNFTGDWNSLFNNNDAEKVAEAIRDIRDNEAEWWRILTTQGYNEGAVKEWLDSLISTADAMDAAREQLKEQLTTTTADDVFDNFLSSLYDLADGVEDVTENIAEDWQKMVNRMVVNNLIGGKMREDLEAWYKQLVQLQQERSDGTIGNDEYKRRLEELQSAYNALIASGKQQIENFTEMGIIKPISEATAEVKEYFDGLRDSWKSALTDMSRSSEDWKNELTDQVFSDLVESTILDAPLDVMTGNTKKHFDNLQAYLDDWTRRYKAVLEDATLSDEQRADRLKVLMEEQTAVMDEQAKKSEAIAESLGKDVVETFSNALDNLGDKLVEFLTDADANAEDMGKEIAATLLREMLKELLAQDKYADQMAAIKQLWQNILKSDSGWWWTDTEGLFGAKGAVWTIDKVVEMIGELEDEIAGDTTLQSVADQIKELEKAVEDGKSSFGDLRDSFMDAILDMENGAANLKKKLNETLVKDLIEKTVFDVPLTVTINEDGKTFKKKFEKGFDEYQEDWTQRYLDIYNSAEYSAEQREQLLQALIDELMKAGEDMAAAAVDLAQRVQDAKLDTTFTDMKDSFVSALMDMDGDIEDFANDMKKTIVQKLVEAFMVSEEIKPLLEKLQETFNYAMGLEGKTPEERAKIISEGYANENGEHQLGLSDITGVLTPLQDTVKAMLEAMGYVAKSTEDEVESVFANLGDTILDSLMNTESGVEDFMSGITETIIRELTESFIATEDFQKKLEDVKQQLEEAVKSGDPAKIDAAKEALRALYREADEGTEEWRKALQKLETEEDSTFKDMTSSWTSSLMDFNATAEDWAEDIGRTMAQKIIEKMVAPTLMQPLLDSLQEVFNTALGAQEEGSVDWSAVVNDSGVQAALTALKNAYPELKETVTAILAALDITPEIDEEEAKEGFSNLRDAFISTLTDINGDAETFAKQIGRTMLEQMLDAYIENTYKDQIASINQEWAEALESGNTEAIERIKQKVQELYSTISTDVEVSNIADAIKELDKQLDTTFSDMADSWTSTLMDMEATAEDWAQSVGKMIAEKIIKSMVIPTMIQPILDTMQKAWNAAAEQEGATYQTMLDAMMPYVGQLVGAYEELRPIADYILNSLGVYKETVEEVAEEVEYHLQDLKSNFVSSLMDMEQSAEDWSESISKIMAEAFIKDFVLGDAFDAQMKDWQAHYESILNSGLSEEDRLKQMKLLRDAIVSAKEGYVEQAMAIQELMGLNAASSSQSATANIADKITYEQADQLLGINMAQEMTLEQILYTLRGGIGVTGVGLGLASSSNSETARQIESTLNSMGGLTSSDSETTREIRGLIIIGNSYLYDIKTSNEQMLRQFGERLEFIDSKIGRIF
ncbi:MAG: tape measure protein [Prevotella sp.]|nr:tape measure protein [Prevotella sp.]